MIYESKLQNILDCSFCIAFLFAFFSEIALDSKLEKTQIAQLWNATGDSTKTRGVSSAVKQMSENVIFNIDLHPHVLISVFLPVDKTNVSKTPQFNRRLKGWKRKPMAT